MSNDNYTPSTTMLLEYLERTGWAYEKEQQKGKATMFKKRDGEAYMVTIPSSDNTNGDDSCDIEKMYAVIASTEGVSTERLFLNIADMETKLYARADSLRCCVCRKKINFGKEAAPSGYYTIQESILKSMFVHDSQERDNVFCSPECVCKKIGISHITQET